MGWLIYTGVALLTMVVMGIFLIVKVDENAARVQSLSEEDLAEVGWLIGCVRACVHACVIACSLFSTTCVVVRFVDIMSSCTLDRPPNPTRCVRACSRVDR